MRDLPPAYAPARARLLRLAHAFATLDEPTRERFADPASRYRCACFPQLLFSHPFIHGAQLRLVAWQGVSYLCIVCVYLSSCTCHQEIMNGKPGMSLCISILRPHTHSLPRRHTQGLILREPPRRHTLRRPYPARCIPRVLRLQHMCASIYLPLSPRLDTFPGWTLTLNINTNIDSAQGPMTSLQSPASRTRSRPLESTYLLQISLPKKCRYPND